MSPYWLGRSLATLEGTELKEQRMTQAWPAVSYDRWAPTCDTLHAHIQVLGKLAIALSPPEPELQHGRCG